MAPKGIKKKHFAYIYIYIYIYSIVMQLLRNYSLAIEIKMYKLNIYVFGQ